MQRVRGLFHLVHDTIDAVTTLVQQTQDRSAQRTVRTLGAIAPVAETADLVNKVRGEVAGGVFDSIRLINRVLEQAEVGVVKLVGYAAQELGARDVDAVAQRVPGFDAFEAGLNAAFGDFLAARQNPLAIELGLYLDGARLTLTAEALAERLPHATPRIAVFVHGLGCTETAFRMYAREHYEDATTCYATQLQRDLGFTPLFVRYNTGRHVSESGRELAQLLDALCRAYPQPIEQLVLVGHSMGGLVSRSAAHYGQLQDAAFVKPLSHVVCIGSPHHGALLEKATNVLSGILGFFPSAGTEVPAKLLNARSAGVKDLRYGYVLDEDWTDKDPDAVLTDARHDVPMLEHVIYAFVAANFARDASSRMGQLFGDLLVRVPSGSGEHPERTRHIPFHAGEVLYGLHHLALINHPAVYSVLQRLLGHVEPAAVEAELTSLEKSSQST